ncbi:MAG: serine/threonine protein phosphatase [Alphaproteobacteria bacterium]|nr:serine/threonine protein phosphatase [Alphaproteobacteria bacterium]
MGLRAPPPRTASDDAPDKPTGDTAGRTIYAIGDVHGRADLLGRILMRIDADRESSAADGPPVLLFLGDYIDRGLQSRAVIDRLLDLREADRYELRLLKGNHEAALLDFLDEPRSGATWLSFGGAETLFSYGVRAPTAQCAPQELIAAARALKASMPAAHLELFEGLELSARYGDYVFVHAGLRPGRLLEDQEEDDILSIRDDFTKSRQRWPYTIVHGHTPTDAVHVDDRRISVDTGAYATGRLSAVRLENGRVRVLST